MLKSWITAVTLVGSLALAHADPAPAGGTDAERATKLYEDGKRHFDIGEYAPAIVSWKEAYLLSNAPLLLFNIGQAYRLSSNCAEANRFYQNYRRVEAHPKNQEELDQATSKCAGVEPAIGDPTPPVVTGTTPPPPVDTPPPSTVTPPPTTVTPPPPPPAIVQPLPPKPQPEEHGGTLRTAGIITGTVGVLALLGSGAYALKASNNASSVHKEPSGTTYAGSVETEDKNGESFANRAKVFVGVGAVLTAAGVTMWYLGHRANEPHLDVAILPGQTEVSFSCAF